jgi:hypothetical protein
VLSAPAGWVDLRRSDVRLWVGRVGQEEQVQPPAGLCVVARNGEVTVGTDDGPVAGPATVCVWVVDTTRPAWAC